MAIDPVVQAMSPKQRERWAFLFTAVLGLLLLSWGIHVYWLHPQQLEQRETHGAGNGEVIITVSDSGANALADTLPH